MDAQFIDNIRRKYRREWLLIKVNKFDKTTSKPVTGRLLAHSPDRDEIYKKSLRYKGLILIDHSDKRLPKGYAVAFTHRENPA